MMMMPLKLQYKLEMKKKYSIVKKITKRPPRPMRPEVKAAWECLRHPDPYADIPRSPPGWEYLSPTAVDCC